MPTEAGETISVQCPCGKRLKAPASAVGRKAKCPKCGNVLTVQAPKPAAAKDDFDDALYDLASDANTAAPITPPPLPRPVATATKPHAGQAVKSAPVGAFPPPLQTKVNVEKPAPSGSMLKGAIISAIFAFVGALIWFGIAKATHREIGWIAWGVGIAAGFGMMIGYNGTSVSAGGVAAMLAVAAILVGKWMVFSVIFNQTLAVLNMGVDRLDDDEKLVIYETQETLKKKGIDPDTSTDEQDDAARAEAEKLVKKMDAKTKSAETDKARAYVKSMQQSIANEIDKTGLFFKTMFSPMDLVFFVIAIASAFKVATFGGEVDNS